MSDKEMIEWSFEVDQDIRDRVCEVCRAWGTTIEDMTAAFIYFCVKPDNAIRCNICGDEIESKHRHDFVQCKCGACAVDGGHDYLRRCFKEEGCFTDISVTDGKKRTNNTSGG